VVSRRTAHATQRRERRERERERADRGTHRTVSLMTPAVSIPAVLFAVLSGGGATTTVRRQRQLGSWTRRARDDAWRMRVAFARVLPRSLRSRVWGSAGEGGVGMPGGRCSIAFARGRRVPIWRFLGSPQPSSTLPKTATFEGRDGLGWGRRCWGSGRLLRV
jgi:hypothetical protein